MTAEFPLIYILTSTKAMHINNNIFAGKGKKNTNSHNIEYLMVYLSPE